MLSTLQWASPEKAANLRGARQDKASRLQSSAVYNFARAGANVQVNAIRPLRSSGSLHPAFVRNASLAYVHRVKAFSRLSAMPYVARRRKALMARVADQLRTQYPGRCILVALSQGCGLGHVWFRD